jgi:2-oxoglutarate dehydrogenase complex dehydrogenase (E1) component-like enzyme
MLTMEDRIRTTKPNSIMFVSQLNESEVWLSMHIENGSMNVTLTKEQAQALIERLTQLVDSLE